MLPGHKEMWATQYLQVLLLWTYFSSGGEKGLKYVPMSNHQSKQGKDDSHSADNELHGSRIYRKFTRETEGSFTPPVSQPRVWVQENYSSFMHFWVNKLFSYQKKKKKYLFALCSSKICCYPMPKFVIYWVRSLAALSDLSPWIFSPLLNYLNNNEIESW